jgi:ParB family chromosome partitioning protein
MKRGGLGRGLGALIPGAPADETATTGLFELPLESIQRSPKQPRTNFEEDALGSLELSVREVGVLQPIVVRRSGDGYEVIAGERRLRAAQRAGLAAIPAVIRESDDTEALQEALIENIHREDLGPIELAEAFRELLEDLGATQDTVAERLGVSRPHVANTLRLLQLPPKVQDLLAERKIQAGHGRALLVLPDADAQTIVAERIAAEDLSVRQVEQLVRRYSQPAPARKKGQAPAPAATPLAEVEERLADRLGTRVSIQMGARQRGKIVVEFGSPDDLERIISEIVGTGPGLAPLEED